MKFATKPMRHYPPHLRHVTTLPWEIKIQIFCRYSADMDKMQANCILIASNFGNLPHINGKYFFEIIVLLLIYFCDQCLALELCHSRRHCSV